MGWKFLLSLVLPMLEALGVQQVNADSNDTGKDDIIGQAILFGVKIFRAVLGGDTEALGTLLPSNAKSVVVTQEHFSPPATS